MNIIINHLNSYQLIFGHDIILLCFLWYQQLFYNIGLFWITYKRNFNKNEAIKFIKEILIHLERDSFKTTMFKRDVLEEEYIIFVTLQLTATARKTKITVPSFAWRAFEKITAVKLTRAVYLINHCLQFW